MYNFFKNVTNNNTTKHFFVAIAAHTTYDYIKNGFGKNINTNKSNKCFVIKDGNEEYKQKPGI